MAELQKIDEPPAISANDARGARGPRDGTLGDTLLPMLIGTIVLTIIGVFAVILIVG